MRSLVILTALAGLWSSNGAASAASGAAVLAHEPLVLQSSASGQPVPQNLHHPAGRRTMVFDAFGRRFELELDDGARLNALRRHDDYRLLRGRLRGIAGSWVRLTARGRKLTGMIWDGHEAYAIEPRSEVAGRLVTPESTGTPNVIYRLADVLMTGPAPACGMDDGTPAEMLAGITGSTSGKTAMDGLVAELQAVRTMEAEGATLRLTVAAVADYEFYEDSLFSESQAESALLTRFNIVDGIYSEQVGVEIEVANIRILTSPDEEKPPFNDTTDAKTLLGQLSEFRQDNHAQFGLTHLVTGRDLTSGSQGSGDFSRQTAGIGFQGLQVNGSLVFGICDFKTGASLSEGRPDPMSGALIIAHEMGHNFGAPHDGEPAEDDEPANPCESVSEDFLMAPKISNNDQFSQCSLDQIAPMVEAGRSSCLTAVPREGVAASGTSAVIQPPDVAFNVAYSVINVGSEAAQNVMAQFTISTSLALEALSADSATCDISIARCDLGTLAAGVDRPVTARLVGSTEGTFPVTIETSADADEDPSDNSKTTQVTIDEPDANPGDSGGGGGGGGALTWPTFAMLLIRGLRRRRTQVIV